MLTNEEKKAAQRAISFNYKRFLSLFLFCLASFCVGISVWYWQQNHSYGQTIDSYKQELLTTLSQQINDHHFTPLSGMSKGIVSCKGMVDFDDVVYLNSAPNLYEKTPHITKVKGQKRQIALGVYEVRFVEN